MTAMPVIARLGGPPALPAIVIAIVLLVAFMGDVASVLRAKKDREGRA